MHPSELNLDSADTNKDFRCYTDSIERVKSFYITQHTLQTVEYNIKARKLYAPGHLTMDMWQALEKLDTLTDESDPDTLASQLQHALQSAEACKRDGKPRWMQLVALIHDAGKMLNFFKVDQWSVVGTFHVI